jgi:hypothetical protein
MANKNEVVARQTTRRSAWTAPRLEELGKLGDLVRSGHANGKSGAQIDGSSSGMDETMN